MNKRDFKLFLDETQYWVNRFGLQDYEIRVATTDDEGVRGTCTTYANNEDRIADICVSAQWEKPEHRDLCRVAFHESCELLMREFFNVCAPVVAGPLVRTELHRLIRRLENSVFVDDYERRFKGGKKHGNKASRSVSTAGKGRARASLIPVDVEFSNTARHASG